MKPILHFWRAVILLGLAVVLLHGGAVQTCAAYSVLTHEQVVDLVWKDNILPLLKNRFPAATDDELKKAHAFAYGGPLIQEKGHYPFRSKDFTEPRHY